MFGKIRSLPTGPDHATTRINKGNSWFELLAPTVITVQRRSWYSASTAVFKPEQGFGGLEILWSCLFDHLPQIATYFVTFSPQSAHGLLAHRESRKFPASRMSPSRYKEIHAM